MKPVAGAERVRVWLADSAAQAESGPYCPGRSVGPLAGRTAASHPPRRGGARCADCHRNLLSSCSPLMVRSSFSRIDYVFDERLTRVLLEQSLARRSVRSLALVDPETPATIAALVTTGSQRRERCSPALPLRWAMGSGNTSSAGFPTILFPPILGRCANTTRPYLLRVGADRADSG